MSVRVRKEIQGLLREKISEMNEQVIIMAKMCKMDACKTSEGMCIHEKMMAVIAMVAIVAVAGKLLQVF